MIEYALMISILVAAAVVAIGGLGTAARRSFSVAGRLTDPLGKTADAGPLASPAERGASTADAPAGDERNWGWLLPLQLGAIGLCVASWLAVQRHNRRRANARREPPEPELPSTLDPGEYLFAKRQQILTALSSATDELAGGQIAVRRLMSRPTAVVSPDATRAAVAEAMATHRTHHLLVCEEGRLVGVISDRDLARTDGGRARDIMTANPVTVEPETPVSPAVTLMIRKRISCLPVVGEGTLCGVFTTTDLVMTLQCAFQLLQRATLETATLDGEEYGVLSEAR